MARNTIGGRSCCGLGSLSIGAAAAFGLYPFKDRQWFESVFLGRRTIQTPRTTWTPFHKILQHLCLRELQKGPLVVLQDILSFVLRKRLVVSRGTQFSL